MPQRRSTKAERSQRINRGGLCNSLLAETFFGVTDQLVDQVLVEIPHSRWTDVLTRACLIKPRAHGNVKTRFREELKRNLIEYQVKGAIETSMIVTPSELDRLTDYKITLARASWLSSISILLSPKCPSMTMR